MVSKHTLKSDFADQKIGEVFLSRKNTGKNGIRSELNTEYKVHF